jgi:hypothetical protein
LIDVAASERSQRAGHQLDAVRHRQQPPDLLAVKYE